MTTDQGEPIINSRDCELAGFDLAAVLEAAKGTPTFDHHLIDAGGHLVDEHTIQAQLAAEAEASADRARREFFGTEMEQDNIP